MTAIESSCMQKRNIQKDLQEEGIQRKKKNIRKSHTQIMPAP